MSNQSVAPKKPNDHPDSKISRRIEDLIEDAEIEAEAEIDQTLRNKNAKIALISVISLGLLFVLYQGIEDKPEVVRSVASTSVEETDDRSTIQFPQPIPFPLMATNGFTANSKNLSPLPQPSGTPGPETDASVKPIEEKPATPAATPTSPVAPTEPSAPAKELKTTSSEPAKSNVADKDEEMSELDKAALKISQALAPAKKLNKAPAPTASKINKPKKVAPPAVIETANFLIQLGAFSVRTNADRMLSNLKRQGWKPYIETRGNNTSEYLVFIGGFSDERGGRSLLQDLKVKGLRPIMHKNPDGTHSIVLGQAESLIGAEAIQMELTQKGILTNIKQGQIDTRMYVVRVGGYTNRPSAQRSQKQLESLGYRNSLIVKSPQSG